MKISKIHKKTHQSANLLILIKIKVDMKLSRLYPNKAWRFSTQEITLRW
jgi:hypothetical protein